MRSRMMAAAAASLGLLVAVASAYAVEPASKAAGPKARLPVPAVYVLDAGGRVAAAFGQSGSAGAPGRCDCPDVPAGTTVGAVDANPLQAAIDFAAARRLREIRLDAGEFTFARPQHSHTGRIGFFVPSGIHLKGAMIGDMPGSVLMPALSLVGDGIAPKQEFELLVLPSGSRTDKSVPLVDTTLEALMLDARLGGGVCLWSGGGRGLKLLRVHAMGSLQTGIIAGTWDETREDPERPGGAAIYYQNDFEIAGCHIHSVHGDGICLIGRDGNVHDNIIENCTSYNNALTPFIGSRRIRFLHNTINNFGVGIGLDGTSMPLKRLPGMDAAAAEKAGRARLQERFRGWDGYNRDHEIAFNTIRNCYRGVVLFRADGIRIHDNAIFGRGQREGISVEESSHCAVWSNEVHGWQIGLQLYAGAGSGLAEDGRLMGTSYNRIGLDPAGRESGNKLTANTIGIAWRKAAPEARLRHNRLAANITAACLVPLDGSPDD